MPWLWVAGITVAVILVALLFVKIPIDDRED